MGESPSSKISRWARMESCTSTRTENRALSTPMYTSLLVVEDWHSVFNHLWSVVEQQYRTRSRDGKSLSSNSGENVIEQSTRSKGRVAECFPEKSNLSRNEQVFREVKRASSGPT